MRFEISSGNFAKEETTQVKIWIKSLFNFPNASIYVEIPNSFSLISGGKTTSVYIPQEDSVSLQYKIVPHSYGNFIMGVIAESLDSSFVENWAWAANEIYVYIDPDTSYYKDTPSEDTTDIHLYEDVIPDSLIKNNLKYPSLLSNENYTLHVEGTVRYKKGTEYKKAPYIRMVLIKRRWLLPDKIISVWETLSDGSYSKTFEVEEGSYSLQVQSGTTGNKVVKWWGNSRDWLVLAKMDFKVEGDKNISWNPYISGRNADIIKILVYAKKTRDWAIGNLRVTPSFGVIGFGKGNFYTPPAYIWLGEEKRIPFTDRIYLNTTFYKTVTHEWSHRYQIMDCFSNEGEKQEKTPRGAGWKTHSYYTVSNGGFAMAEGFPEYMEYAVWQSEGVYKKAVEDFYAFQGPYYKGEEGINEDGRKVEGAVMQFFWDLCDNMTTNDGDGMDDEGVYDKYSHIGTVLKKIGEEVEAYKFPSRLSYIYVGDIDIEVFREKWNDQYGTHSPPPSPLVKNPNYINEIYYVTFFGIKPPAPSGLTVTPYDCYASLSWQDNAYNEGAFFVYREPPWPWTDIITVPIPNTEQYVDYNISGDFIYCVKALTCDTSDFSNPVGVHVNCNAPAAPSKEPWQIIIKGSQLYFHSTLFPTVVKIYDASGKCIRMVKVKDKDSVLLLMDDEISNGVYFLYLNAEKFRTVKKFIFSKGRFNIIGP